MLDAKEKEWLCESSFYSINIFQDSLGRQEVFTLDNEYSGFNSSMSTSGLFGLREREKDEYQTIHQEFRNKSGELIRIYIAANEAPQGTELSIYFKDLRILVDINYKHVFMVRSEDQSKWEHFSDHMYETYFDEEIRSRLTYLDSLEVRGTVYHSIFNFDLKDFKEYWTDSTIVSLSYAKKYGILSYETNGGEVWERVGEGREAKPLAISHVKPD